MGSRILAVLAKTASIIAGTLLLFPAAATASYVSTGADGSFRPTSSVTLDWTRSVYNFTDIAIPVGVTVTFGGIAEPASIALLATGLVTIDGTLDGGGLGNLWIETPDAIAISGTGTVTGFHSIGLAATTLSLGGTLDIVGGTQPVVGGNTPVPVRDGSAIICASDCLDLPRPIPVPAGGILFISGLALLGRQLTRRGSCQTRLGLA